MSIQYSFYAVDGKQLKYPQTKRIATKQHCRVLVKQISDGLWVIYPESAYNVENGSVVALDSIVNAEIYSNVEVRVADSQDELGDSLSDIAIVASIANEIVIVATDPMPTNITTVAGISGDVTKVANIDTDVTKVSAIDTNVVAVSNIDTDVTKVANIDANVTKVADIDTDVTAVANIDTDVTTVAGSDTEVVAVADDLAKGLGTNQPTDSSILNALTNASVATTGANTATTKASEASVSADDAEVSAYGLPKHSPASTATTKGAQQYAEEASTAPVLTNKAMVPKSKVVDGSLAIVADVLVGTDLNIASSDGYDASGAYNTSIIKNGNIDPHNGWTDGNNYVKYVPSEDKYYSTLVKPLEGEVSAVGDYFIDGKSYDLNGAELPSQTYLDAIIEVSGGIPQVIHEYEVADIVTGKMVAETVEVNDIFIGKNTIESRGSFDASAVMESGLNFQSVTYSNGSYAVLFTTPMLNNTYQALITLNQTDARDKVYDVRDKTIYGFTIFSTTGAGAGVTAGFNFLVTGGRD